MGASACFLYCRHGKMEATAVATTRNDTAVHKSFDFWPSRLPSLHVCAKRRGAQTAEHIPKKDQMMVQPLPYNIKRCPISIPEEHAN